HTPPPARRNTRSNAPGRRVLYTTDGSDPRKGKVYSKPFMVSADSVVTAVASADCAVESPAASALYKFGPSSTTDQTMLQIGNSLISELPTQFPPLVAAGGLK